MSDCLITIVKNPLFFKIAVVEFAAKLELFINCELLGANNSDMTLNDRFLRYFKSFSDENINN